MAAEHLEKHDLSLKVINMPWLNRVDIDWLEKVIGTCELAFVVDDHSPYGGLGDSLLNAFMSSDTLRGRQLVKYAVDGSPACGTPEEVLAHHNLSGEKVSTRILKAMKAQPQRLLEAAS